MENQKALWRGLGLTWKEPPVNYQRVKDQLPRQWVITNLTDEVCEVNIRYDIDQRLDIKPGRNLLCLCNPLLREEICARDGDYSEYPCVLVSESKWNDRSKISYVHISQDQSEHIIIKYRDSVTSLQDSIVATLTEEKMKYLKNSAYRYYVKNYQTHRLDFSLYVYEDDGSYQWNTEELWPWAFCSCGYRRRLTRL